MTFDIIIGQGILAGFAALLVAAAWSDATRLRIPNRVAAGVAGLYGLWAIVGPASIAVLPAAAIAAAMLALGFLAFQARLLGGGDVKLLAATALWAAPDLLIEFVFTTALAGGALALVLMPPWHRAMLGRLCDALGRPAWGEVVQSGLIPYGAAIACGGLLVAAIRSIGLG